jgi:hypothetical protein
MLIILGSAVTLDRVAADCFADPAPASTIASLNLKLDTRTAFLPKAALRRQTILNRVGGAFPR